MINQILVECDTLTELKPHPPPHCNGMKKPYIETMTMTTSYIYLLLSDAIYLEWIQWNSSVKKCLIYIYNTIYMDVNLVMAISECLTHY